MIIIKRNYSRLIQCRLQGAQERSENITIIFYNMSVKYNNIFKVYRKVNKIFIYENNIKKEASVDKWIRLEEIQ